MGSYGADILGYPDQFVSFFKNEMSPNFTLKNMISTYAKDFP